MGERTLVVIRISGATLTRNFERHGKMDPFATATVQSPGAPKAAAWARTPTAWDAHMTPSWDFTSRPSELELDDVIQIKVFEDDIIGKSDFCGGASAQLSDLLGAGEQELPLFLGDGEPTGHITVTLCEVPPQQTEWSRVGPGKFCEDSVKPLGVSGGTAAFYSLEHSTPTADRGVGFYIGKDVSRAVDEVKFYERSLAIRQREEDGDGLGWLLSHSLEYLGILSAAGVDLLVLENLCDGQELPRLVDLKIGEKTASAGWQGKSRFRALKQSFVDKWTNSAAEGYRLEGFDGQPAALCSVLTHLTREMEDHQRLGAKAAKKARRMLLQTMSGGDIFRRLVDLHHMTECHDGVDSHLTSCELSERVLHTLVSKLARLSVACQRVEVPQKWVGSSIALGFDAGKLPKRTEPADDGVLVKLFDWGRSELLTAEAFEQLSARQQADRRRFWSYYCGGVSTLTWNAAREYFRRFGNAEDWDEVSLRMVDFDAMTKDDFLGEVFIPLKPSDGDVTVNLSPEGRGTITFAISWRELPAGSRLKGSWRVTVLHARDLVASDRTAAQASDPYCVVTASSKAGYAFSQSTCVVSRCLNPDFNETFDLAISSDPDALHGALANGGLGVIGELALPDLFALKSGLQTFNGVVASCGRGEAAAAGAA